MVNLRCLCSNWPHSCNSTNLCILQKLCQQSFHISPWSPADAEEKDTASRLWLSICTGFGWGGVNFLCSSPYGAVFWISAENSVDIMEMWLLLSSTCSESRPFQLLTPALRVGWGCMRSLEGTQPGQLTPTNQRDIPDHMASRSAYKAVGEGREETLEAMAFCLPKYPLHMM